MRNKKKQLYLDFKDIILLSYQNLQILKNIQAFINSFYQYYQIYQYNLSTDRNQIQIIKNQIQKILTSFQNKKDLPDFQNHHSMSETLQEKQNFLHYEIIQQQYDPEQFQQFMQNQKGLNLEEYSMKQLIQIVKRFKKVDIQYNDNKGSHSNQQISFENSKLQKRETQDNYKEDSNTNLKEGQISFSQIINNQGSENNQLKKKVEQKDEKNKKVSINLKQMIIPQYKPSAASGKKQQTNRNSIGGLYRASSGNRSSLFVAKKKQQNSSQISSETLPTPKSNQLHKGESELKKEEKNYTQSKPLKKSFYQQDEEQNQKQSDFDKAFVGNENASRYDQSFARNNQSLIRFGVDSQSIYIPSSKNKQPYVITKKNNFSSLYKEIKSSSYVDKNGKTKSRFFQGFSIKVKSFSKKKSNSIFKFPYVTYHVQTIFGQQNQKNQKMVKDQNKTKSKVWKVQRRFNDFKWLHDFLMKNYYGNPIPPIPLKTKMRSFDDEHLQQRMIVFQKFLNKCIHIDQIASDPIFEAFLSIQSIQELDAVKNKFSDKLKNRDQNLMEFINGQDILSYGQGITSISQNTRVFLSRQCQLLQCLNLQLRQLEKNIKQASGNAISASNILRQLSQLHKQNRQFQIKGSAIFDVTSEYIGQLSYKLDNQAYYLKNYIANTWLYEEMYNINLLSRISSLDRHKNVLETKFKDIHSKQNSQMTQSFADNQGSVVTNTKNNQVYKKTKQLYEINLSLTIQEINRHLQKDLLIISNEFSCGISQYMNQIKDQMMTGVDLMTKAITVSEGKELKEVELISQRTRETKKIKIVEQ